MSGSNGILKPVRSNREDEIKDLKYRRTIFTQQKLKVAQTPDLTVTDMFEGFAMTANMIVLFNSPTTMEMVSEISKRYLTEIGSSWWILVKNEEAGVDKTIHIPWAYPHDIIIKGACCDILCWRVKDNNTYAFELLYHLTSQLDGVIPPSLPYIGLQQYQVLTVDNTLNWSAQYLDYSLPAGVNKDLLTNNGLGNWVAHDINYSLPVGVNKDLLTNDGAGHWTAQNIDYSLPTGTNGQVLTNNGAGHWAAANIPSQFPVSSTADILTYDGVSYKPTSTAADTNYSSAKGIQILSTEQLPPGFGSSLSPASVINSVDTAVNYPRTTIELRAAPTLANSLLRRVCRITGGGTFGNNTTQDYVCNTTQLPSAGGSNPSAGPTPTTTNGGAYHLQCTNGSSVVAYITLNGQFRIGTPRSIGGGTALFRDPISGEICFLPSVDIMKTNVQPLDDEADFIERLLFSSAVYEWKENNLDRVVVSEMADFIHRDPGLSERQKKMIIEYEFCDHEKKFNFDKPVGINTVALVSILKTYTIRKLQTMQNELEELKEKLDYVIKGGVFGNSSSINL